ncbi:protein TBATA [Hemiscyllium ocellatum]|uniref:protein TBATA n=1 Tax=Hemiscyllium ocellatum TaxID=170820 RepID=UPI00296633E5|nr:protein TBATA [Hemiscyllium ocellatum]
MTTATNEVVSSKYKQDTEKASIKETMEKLGQPVIDPFMNKEEHKVMDKLGTVPLNSLLRFSVDAERPQSKPKSSSRFGRLSYHSFFSRHNPHPHRVRHINGLNGNPVCAVNDDWYINTPLSPHPLIKSRLPTTVLGRLGLPISIYQCNPFDDGYISKFTFASSAKVIKKASFISESLSEAWRDELREFTTRACLLAPDQPEEQKETEGRRTTQYSAQTGRIIPNSTPAVNRQTSQRSTRNDVRDRSKHNMLFQDHELLVLELLCQLLQTDSLSAVQQWLLYAGQREKDFVLGMIQSALASSHPEYQQRATCREGQGKQQIDYNPTASALERSSLNRRKHNRYYLKKKPEIIEEEQPDHIGNAEVLRVHQSKSSEPQSNGKQEVSDLNRVTGCE